MSKSFGRRNHKCSFSRRNTPKRKLAGVALEKFFRWSETSEVSTNDYTTVDKHQLYVISIKNGVELFFELKFRLSKKFLPPVKLNGKERLFAKMLLHASWNTMSMQVSSHGVGYRCIEKKLTDFFDDFPQKLTVLQSFSCQSFNRIAPTALRGNFLVACPPRCPLAGGSWVTRLSTASKVGFLAKKANFFLLQKSSQVPRIGRKQHELFRARSFSVQSCKALLRDTKFTKVPFW